MRVVVSARRWRGFIDSRYVEGEAPAEGTQRSRSSRRALESLVLLTISSTVAVSPSRTLVSPTRDTDDLSSVERFLHDGRLNNVCAKSSSPWP